MESKTALVLGGAKCVHEDIAAALALFTPDVIVAVKDIGITYPKYDYWATLHPERLPKELGQRRASGLVDPVCIYTYAVRGVGNLGVPIKTLKITGGSSGMLGTEVALLHAARVVLTGTPLDPKQVHYRRPRKDGWKAAVHYRKVWTDDYPRLKDRVRSMSGWTKELLGAPTKEWLEGRT